ncbi:vWA domain-containing protein [Intrasporangium sp.]|uniref:vWA domain-containing protein n=1 Tax=Intrasporangium sp. TaxID=1925024 RepID=UPI0032219654
MSRGSAGLVLTAAGARGEGGRPDTPGRSASGTTDEAPDGTTEPPHAELDPRVLRLARQISARLVLPRPRPESFAQRGPGDLESLPYRGSADDIDLDATLERMVGQPVLEPRDIVVRERRRTRRAVVLAVDVSGSMRGERIRTAAATVGALVGALSDDELAVLAFWSDAALVQPLRRGVRADTVLDTLVRIPARGLTNTAFPLELARAQLDRASVAEPRVLLLSDCVHNAGPDPVPLAARLARLDVLLDLSGEHDTGLGRDLARAGRGRLELVHGHRDVVPALARIFGT